MAAWSRPNRSVEIGRATLQDAICSG